MGDGALKSVMIVARAPGEVRLRNIEANLPALSAGVYGNTPRKHLQPLA